MLRRITLLLTGLVLLFQTFGQPKLLTPEDASNNNPALFPKSLRNLSWVPGTTFYSYSTEPALLKINALSGVTDTIVRLSNLNQMLIQNNEKARKVFPSINWLNGEEIWFRIGKNYYGYNIPEKNLWIIATLPENAENADFCEKNQSVAYTLGNNLYIAKGENQITISEEIDQGIVVGSERVHRNEWGISKGTFWSPDGNLLAFYRMDETMVTNYPLMNIESRPAEVENTRYPMAGMTIHKVTIGIYNPSTRSTTYLDTQRQGFDYLTNVTWSPDSKKIYVAVLNRAQNHLWLNRYDAITGTWEKTLFEETNDKYVEPERGPWFLPNKSGQFVWFSERDGFDHLYLYDGEGKLIKQLTSGPWVVKQIIGYSERTSEIIFTATKDSPLESNVYAVNVNNNKIRNISSKGGIHSAFLSPDGSFIIDSYNNPDFPRRIELINLKNLKSKELHNAENPLKEYRLGKTQIFTLKNEEGIDLYCRMITPPDMDTNRKYPVIIYVYGGPHAQLVTNGWLNGAGFYLNYLTQQGYIVFTLDNRGSANRGFEFESTIHRRVGELEARDQMVGVKYLKSLPYVDSTRIGVDGWSYGGFMTINLLLRYPGVFKAATAGGPVCDWKYYEAMYGERYMDTPEENPEGYKASSLIEHADQLNDRLMIIHCTTDPVVVWQNSLQFIKACIEKGKLVDYFVYPGHEHNVRGPDRAHLIRKIEDYFKRNL